MDATQYEINLPADFDMSVIRDRVYRRAHLLDNFPGLALKAYLIQEIGALDSPVNQYAPFYLWNQQAPMRHFFFGAKGFEGVCESFGRPPVRHWPVARCLAGAGRAGKPLWATRRCESLPGTGDPSAHINRFATATDILAADERIHTCALLVDMSTWATVSFALWTSLPPAEAGVRYQVVRLSSPAPIPL